MSVFRHMVRERSRFLIDRREGQGRLLFVNKKKQKNFTN